MTSAEHDDVCAAVSHLPHLLASVYLQAFFASQPDWSSLGGAAFRDWLRIAGGCPEIWMDIFWTNRKKVLSGILRFQKELDEVRSYLENDDAQKLEDFLHKVFHLKEDLGK